jgi:thiol-disulfide isomerase/thioredoxin
VSTYLGREYNYTAWVRSLDEFALFKTLTHAGDAAPAFTLEQVDGAPMTLADLRGLPVVLEFGSLTCPPCQAGFPALDGLAREFDGQAHFYFIYVREAHPERFPEYPAHQSYAGKRARAQALRDKFDTPRRVLVDTLDGDVHRAYGGLPNMSWVLDHTGHVFFKGGWTAPRDIRRALDAVLPLCEQDPPHGPLAPYYQEWLLPRASPYSLHDP